MMERVIVRIAPEYLMHVWPKVANMIAAAADHSRGQYTAAAVYDEIAAGNRQLWIAATGGEIEAVICTRVVEHPGKRSLYVSMAAGALDALKDFSEPIKGFARHWGCGLVCIMGRPGWGRVGVLPPEFRHTADVWTAEVVDV